MNKNYRIAGIGISMRIPDQYCTQQDGILAPYRVESLENPEIFTYTVVKDLDSPIGECCCREPRLNVFSDGEKECRYLGGIRNSWETAYLRSMHDGMMHAVQIRDTAVNGVVTEKVLLSSIAPEHLLVKNGGVILHASYVACNGKAILFTAPSGTGKSTQADLWVKYRSAELVNGDRVGIRMNGNEVLACGIPFAGSSGISKNITMPVSAIVYLEQASRSCISRLRGSQAFRKIWEGCSVNQWNKEDVTRAMNTVLEIIQNVPVYYFPCTPDENAVTVLESTLKEQHCL